jgi:hypothetical protein
VLLTQPWFFGGFTHEIFEDAMFGGDRRVDVSGCREG